MWGALRVPFDPAIAVDPGFLDCISDLYVRIPGQRRTLRFYGFKWPASLAPATRVLISQGGDRGREEQRLHVLLGCLSYLIFLF